MYNTVPLHVGLEVVWHTGFYGGEHGRIGRDTWYDLDKTGWIVRIEEKHCLIELADMTRAWADKNDLQDVNSAKKDDGIRERNLQNAVLPSSCPGKYASTSGTMKSNTDVNPHCNILSPSPR